MAPDSIVEKVRAVGRRPTARIPTAIRDRFSILRRSKDLLAYGLMAPSLLIVAVLLVVPAIYTGWVSIHSWSLLGSQAPEFVGLENYSRIFGDSELRSSLVRTGFFVAATVTVQFVGGFSIAVFLDRFFGELRLLRTVLLLPLMVSEVVVGLSWRLLFQYDGGLINWLLEQLGISSVYWLGPDVALLSVVIADAWQNIPFVTLIIFAALQTVPTELLEAAELDGTGAWGRIRYIIIPLIKPAILVVLIFRTIFAIRTFATIWILTEGGPGRATTLISIDAFKLAFRNFNMGLGAAMAFCLLLMGLIVTVFYMKWLSREPI